MIENKWIIKHPINLKSSMLIYAVDIVLTSTLCLCVTARYAYFGSAEIRPKSTAAKLATAADFAFLRG